MSVSALLALLSGPMLALLFASYNVSLLVLLRAFLSFFICFVSWLLGSFILVECSNYCQNWIFVLCDNFSGFEFCCHFQNWSKSIMWIGFAFQNFVDPEYIVELKYIESKLYTGDFGHVGRTTRWRTRILYLNFIFLKKILLCPKNSLASNNHTRTLVTIFKWP